MLCHQNDTTVSHSLLATCCVTKMILLYHTVCWQHVVSPKWYYCITQFVGNMLCHQNDTTVSYMQIRSANLLAIPNEVFKNFYCSMAQAVTTLALYRPGFDPRPVHVGSVVNEVALGLVFSKYFGFPVSTTPLTLIFHSSATVNSIISATDTSLKHTPPYEFENNNFCLHWFTTARTYYIGTNSYQTV